MISFPLSALSQSGFASKTRKSGCCKKATIYSTLSRVSYHQGVEGVQRREQLGLPLAKQIHYEVLVIRAGDTGWVLQEAFAERGVALNAAKYALLQKTFSGAKVIKETCNLATGEYLPITVFEEGGPKVVKHKRQLRPEDVRLPCVTPSDLYGPEARAAISRVLEDTLKGEGLTTMELLHRADVLQSLQSRGTVMQHAVQKWAVVQASAENLPVTEIIKQLNDLVSRGMARVFTEDRAGRCPKGAEGNLGRAWEAARAAPEPNYVINCAIARTLSKVSGCSKKLPLLLSLMDHLPGDERGQAACLASIDDFAAEMVSGRASLADFLGAQPDLGASLTLMVDLFLGNADNPDIAGRPGLKQLAGFFANDGLPHSRKAIVTRVLQELNGIKRLSPDDINREVALTRSLAKRMVLCQGPMVSLEDIVSAFETRSVRLTALEMAEEYMAAASTPDARIELLLDLEDNIIGSASKARLVNYILPILTGPKMERLFLDTDEPLLRRLGCLAALQGRVLASGFPETEKGQVVEAFDVLSSRVEEEGQLFQSISRRAVSGAEKALTMLRLLDAKVLTEGTCATRASRHILQWMRDPEFVSELGEVKFSPGPGASENPLIWFRDLVAKTGVQERVQAAKVD